MRKGIATPERHPGKLTMVVKTRSPIEAFQMLRAGQPIDQALGYYVDQGYAQKDVFLMDQVEKLQALAHFRELRAQHKSDIDMYKQQVDSLTKTQISNEKEVNAGPVPQ